MQPDGKSQTIAVLAVYISVVSNSNPIASTAPASQRQFPSLLLTVYIGKCIGSIALFLAWSEAVLCFILTYLWSV